MTSYVTPVQHAYSAASFPDVAKFNTRASSANSTSPVLFVAQPANAHPSRENVQCGRFVSASQMQISGSIDPDPPFDYNGIRQMPVIDFLLAPHSQETM